MTATAPLHRFFRDHKAGRIVHPGARGQQRRLIAATESVHTGLDSSESVLLVQSQKFEERFGDEHGSTVCVRTGLSPRWGLCLLPTFPHGLRRGLHSFAASRLRAYRFGFVFDGILVLSHTLQRWVRVSTEHVLVGRPISLKSFRDPEALVYSP